MTITEQDIEFFKEAKRIQELWEQEPGDWVFDEKYGVGVTMSGGPFLGKRGVSFARAHIYSLKKYLVFLPRQGQLWEMLEERGRFLMFRGQYAMQERRYQVTAMGEDLSRLDARIDAFGPTPSIALGKCLLEVLDGEQT